MSIPTYEIEVTRRVYDNEHGGYFDVGPDEEGLGLIEVTNSDGDARLMIQPAHALVLAQAIAAAAKEMMV